MRQKLIGEILNYAVSCCGGEILLRARGCKIRRGASVNGCSQWIEFQWMVAPAINFGPDNQYEIWPPCNCCVVRGDSPALEDVKKE